MYTKVPRDWVSGRGAACVLNILQGWLTDENFHDCEELENCRSNFLELFLKASCAFKSHSLPTSVSGLTHPSLWQWGKSLCNVPREDPLTLPIDSIWDLSIAEMSPISCNSSVWQFYQCICKIWLSWFYYYISGTVTTLYGRIRVTFICVPRSCSAMWLQNKLSHFLLVVRAVFLH